MILKKDAEIQSMPLALVLFFYISLQKKLFKIWEIKKMQHRGRENACRGRKRFLMKRHSRPVVVFINATSGRVCRFIKILSRLGDCWRDVRSSISGYKKGSSWKERRFWRRTQKYNPSSLTCISASLFKRNCSKYGKERRCNTAEEKILVAEQNAFWWNDTVDRLLCLKIQQALECVASSKSVTP